MDFAFSEEQQMLREQARAFMADKLPLETVAGLADSDDGWDPKSWRQIAELGWVGLSSPEAAGGAGMSFIDEAVLFEELGYALYPGPYFSTVALALPALESNPDLLSAVAAGEASATLAWAEPGGPSALRDAGRVATTAERAGERWTLSGTKALVPDLGLVDTVVVVARAPEGIGLWAIEAAGEGVERTSLSTMDTTRRLGRLSLEAVPATVLVVPGDADAVVERIRRRALASLALEAVGIAQRAFELAQEHAGERRQFDKPIGVYQAVSHQIANTYMECELARSLAYWAAWCVAENEQAALASATAKAAAAEAAVDACERSIQVHGGIGFTWEHALHRLYKRAQWIESFEGYGSAHRSEIAAHVLA
ncbi:MAG: acyl-CoA dehydrogenase family protein [Actinomycetota bacterium]